jgi:transposase InsO family protein
MGNRHFTQDNKLAILRSAEKIGIKEAARAAEVHYTSVYEWKRQLEALGEEGFLAYQPSRPGRGLKQISGQKEEAVLSTWKRYPAFGPGQVGNQLRRQGITVSIKTVRGLMEANGYKSSRRKADKADEGERFEARRPLELCQMDILEFFINPLKAYLLVLLDDFSRFILGFRLLAQTSVDEVIVLVQEAIDRYGKMEELLTDRGFVFYSWKGANRFEKYLEVERIEHTLASAHHPKTLGKIEALNGHLRSELLERERFCGVEEAKRALGQWVSHYNYERTHQGLGGLFVPADRFHGFTERVVAGLGNGDDTDPWAWYAGRAVERSIINLTVDPQGKAAFYLLGQPLALGPARAG